jgi:hypothetical protein
MRGETRREGRYIPYDAFAYLGLTPDDMPLVQDLLASAVPA